MSETPSQRWRRRNPEAAARSAWQSNIKQKYGLTYEQYDLMFAAQGGLCAVCGQTETVTYRGKPKRLAVDHDHGTGRVRKLLCHKCNAALGVFWNPALMARAMEYLHEHAE